MSAVAAGEDLWVVGGEWGWKIHIAQDTVGIIEVTGRGVLSWGRGALQQDSCLFEGDFLVYRKLCSFYLSETYL